MLPKSYKGYQLIWRAAEDFGLFWTETVYLGFNYFIEEGVFMFDDGRFSAYHSPSEWKVAGDYGLSFYQDKQNIDKMFQIFPDSKKKIDIFLSYMKTTNLSTCSNQKILDLYKYAIEAPKRVLEAYLYNEPQFIWKLEEKIREHIAKYESNHVKQGEIYSLLLNVPKNKKDKITFEQQRILKEFEFPKKLIQFVSAIRRSGIERFDIKKPERKLYAERLPLIQEVARRTHLSLSQLDALYFKEFKDLLLKEKSPNLQKVNERRKSWFVFIKRKNKKMVKLFLEGERAKKEVKKLEKDVFGSASKILKGEPAYPGKVKGNARVFPYFANPMDLSKHMKTMENKEILVSVHTTPQMIPVILKSCAIVTDEGGINGHAGIVSREFKIPCIIGVGNATERIKTGMEIEVDATNGTITIQ